MAQLFGDVTHLAPLRKWKADMGAGNDQRLLILLFLFLKLQRPVDLGMVSLHLSLTHQNLYPKSDAGLRDFHNPIDGLVVDPSRYVEPQILEDGMNGIDQ